MNGIDALKLLKKGNKIRKLNWDSGWFIFINNGYFGEDKISSYFIDYSPKMKKDMEIKDDHRYSDIIEDLVYENWETHDDDRN
jgi:hypothetical protein